MRKIIAAAVAATTLVTPAAAAAQSLIPLPVKLTAQTGHFTITARTIISTDAGSAPLGRQLARWLEPATGFRFRVLAGGSAPGGSISLRRDASLNHLGDEGYRLDVRPGGIVARAPGSAGLFHAVQTIRQLLPVEIFRDAPVAGVAWRMAAVAIEDYPRFAWRGGHLDVARHFMPKEFVKKYIDLLALHKLNTLPLAPHRGPGLAARDQEVSAADRGGRLAQRDARRPVPSDRESDVSIRRRSRTAASTRRTTRARSSLTQEPATSPSFPRSRCPVTSLAAIAAYPELGVTGQPRRSREALGHLLGHPQRRGGHDQRSCRTCSPR